MNPIQKFESLATACFSVTLLPSFLSLKVFKRTNWIKINSPVRNTPLEFLKGFWSPVFPQSHRLKNRKITQRDNFNLQRTNVNFLFSANSANQILECHYIFVNCYFPDLFII